jgi:hypothetical protein
MCPIIFRHSSLELTMGTSTDPRLLDVAGALGVLPALPLDDEPTAQRAKVTGTCGVENTAAVGTRFVPGFAPAAGDSSTNGATPVKPAESNTKGLPCVSDATDKPYSSEASAVKLRVLGLEPRTHGLKGRCSTY